MFGNQKYPVDTIKDKLSIPERALDDARKGLDELSQAAQKLGLTGLCSELEMVKRQTSYAQQEIKKLMKNA